MSYGSTLAIQISSHLVVAALLAGDLLAASTLAPSASVRAT
jgi:hypothetical protein